MALVFLGGTCNDSTWRDELIPMLTCSYFNPVVEDWTDECVQEEYKQKKEAFYELYVITPEQTGCFTVAEMINSSIDNLPGRTLIAILGSWNSNNSVEHEKLVSRFLSLNRCADMAVKNGAVRFHSLKEIAEFLNVN